MEIRMSSEDPGTDSSQSTDNKTPSNGGGSSKKDGSGTEQNGSTEQPDTEQSLRHYMISEW